MRRTPMGDKPPRLTEEQREQIELETLQEANKNLKRAEPPYPWCLGHPTRESCAHAGYCQRNPNCGE